MAGIGRTDGQQTDPDLALREPRQRRTREQWERILDAGILLLEEGGYEAFTIAALCDRAQVPPRALYARAPTKDALFLAVYERGMSQVLADHQVFADPDRWNVDDDRARVEQAVRFLVQIFIRNGAFLRAVVLISGVHPEVLRRGEDYRNAIYDLFTAALRPLNGNPLDDDALREREVCFALLFSALVLRTAYGPKFGPAGEIEQLTRELVTMAQRYLRVDLPAPTAQQ
ncbi:MAG: TetR/AcrR family transcriptional regulator [Nocardioides sp.]